MNYTEYMENALWQQWNELDDELNNVQALNFLNSEYGIRTFGEALTSLISKNTLPQI